MALMLADSFDHLSTAHLTRKWSYFGTNSAGGIAAVGRNGTNGFQLVGQSGDLTNLGYNFTATKATVIMGAAIKLSSATGVVPLFRLLDAGTLQLFLQFNADASLSVINGSGAVVGTTAPGALPSPTIQHNHVQFKCTISDAAGVAVVKVNNVVVLNLAAVDTKNTGNAYATTLELRTFIAGNTVYYDDFWLVDTTGATCNDFLGDVRVEYRTTTGGGNYTVLVPSVGANYQCVDDNPANDETDYNSSSTVGDKDTYAMQDLASVLGAVLAVAVVSMDRKDDAGARTHSHIVRLGGVDVEGTAFPPTVAYAVHQTFFETKPGGGAWTIADVNNVEAGFKLAA